LQRAPGKTKLLHKVKALEQVRELHHVRCIDINSASCDNDHAVVPEKERQKMRIENTLLRLSVGLEAWEDIQDDLKHALEKV
jgi:cystathionine beta-lyase/cystathionine gamma-synthase